MKFKSWFCSDSKLIFVKKKIKKVNTLISTIHFQLHNYMTHLSNVLKLSRSFDTQWNLSCWKYKINKFYFGTNTKSTNLRIQELVIFNQTTKIDTHEEKYFHSNYITVEGVHIMMNTLQKIALKLDENFNNSICFKILPPFDPFYVKNSNSYIITLCIFLKGIFLRNTLKKPHQKQMNKWPNNEMHQIDYLFCILFTCTQL